MISQNLKTRNRLPRSWVNLPVRLLTGPVAMRLRDMKHEGILYVAAAVLCLGWLLTPGKTQAARNRDFNINFDNNAETCADLKVRSTGEIGQVNDSFTLSKGEAPLLELNAADRGQIRVRGWDRAGYSVETCKIAVAETRGAAEDCTGNFGYPHRRPDLL